MLVGHHRVLLSGNVCGQIFIDSGQEQGGVVSGVSWPK